ncbi:MAG: DNA-3-methyladenine glycosylase [Betaproteobacteria bacterium]|nr:DNA-3-methyladenine glycosylase [Betaproteobacteria bacterium]MCX7195438.1 DNA-3-methyladenine glycosylase [Pseudomonadota bacterium]
MTVASGTTSTTIDPFGPAVAYLADLDPDWASLITRVGRCGLQPKREREPYEALIRAVAYQQLHARAAEAILNRFLALYTGVSFPSPTSILATDESVLRACGFSAAKVLTIRGIAKGMLDGVVPVRSAALTMTDEELISRLVSLRGIGRWTVEMFLIFTLERPDVLPIGDFGVREGWRVMKSLSRQPLPKELSKIGLAWSPYRSTATWYLWQAAEEFKRLKSK